MDILEVLERKRADARARAESIHSAALAAGRELTDEETKSFDAAMAEAEAASAKIADIHARGARIKAVADAETVSAGRKSESVPIAPADVSVRSNAAQARVQVLDSPSRGFKSPREFFAAVRDVTIRRAKMDDRLARLRVSSDFRAAAGTDEQQGSTNAYGGFLVPEAFSPNLKALSPEIDPLSSRVMPVPMEAPTVKVPARVDKNHATSVSGGLRFYRRTETVAATTSRMEMELIRLTAEPLTGASFATEEILQDSALSFVALLERGFRDELPAKLMDERINGSGSSGEFLGVLNATDAAGTGPTLSIAKETGQAAATINYTNIRKMRAKCWNYANAIWLANHDALVELTGLSHVVGVGGAPVWQTSAREGEPETLLGRPIVFTEFCKTVGTVGDILLGVWSEYLEGTYSPLEMAESVHVRFLEHERCFKFNLRNCGAPWWRSALTPKNSTSKLSPFVVLATRA